MKVAWLLPHRLRQKERCHILSSVHWDLATEMFPLAICQELYTLFTFFTESFSSSILTSLKVCHSLQALWSLYPPNPNRCEDQEHKDKRIKADVTTACQLLWGPKQSVRGAAPWNGRPSQHLRLQNSTRFRNSIRTHTHHIEGMAKYTLKNQMASNITIPQLCLGTIIYLRPSLSSTSVLTFFTKPIGSRNTNHLAGEPQGPVPRGEGELVLPQDCVTCQSCTYAPQLHPQ